MSNLFHPIPVYVTNKTADGDIAQYTMPAIFALGILLMVLVNALLWGAIGIVQAIQIIVGVL